MPLQNITFFRTLVGRAQSAQKLSQERWYFQNPGARVPLLLQIYVSGLEHFLTETTIIVVPVHFEPPACVREREIIPF